MASDSVVAGEQLDGPPSEGERLLEFARVRQRGRQRHRAPALELGVAEVDRTRRPPRAGDSTDSSTRRSSRQAVPSTRSSSTRSPSAADGNRDRRRSRWRRPGRRTPGQQVGGLIHPGSRVTGSQHGPAGRGDDVAGIRAPGDDGAHPRRGEARPAPARPAGLARVGADGVGAVGDPVHPRAAVGERVANAAPSTTRRRSSGLPGTPGSAGSRCRPASARPAEGEIDGIGGVVDRRACRATRPGSASRRRRRCRPRRRSGDRPRSTCPPIRPDRA